jgi:uncharacterized membrane protein
MVLNAYFHAEHVRAFRRLLWRRLGAMAAVWLTIALTTSLLPRVAVVTGVALLVGLACGAAIIEWKADRRLNGLLADVVRQ